MVYGGKKSKVIYKLVELISKLTKVTGYSINIQKLFFSYIQAMKRQKVKFQITLKNQLPRNKSDKTCANLYTEKD